VQLLGFITKKFVTMHGHMNVKFVLITSVPSLLSAYGPGQIFRDVFKLY